MTIGSIEQSKSTDAGPNEDFETLIETVTVVEDLLKQNEAYRGKWGVAGEKLELSMGMSSDFEQAILAGAGTVRVGTSIFGVRPPRGEK